MSEPVREGRGADRIPGDRPRKVERRVLELTALLHERSHSPRRVTVLHKHSLITGAFSSSRPGHSDSSFEGRANSGQRATWVSAPGKNAKYGLRASLGIKRRSG